MSNIIKISDSRYINLDNLNFTYVEQLSEDDFLVFGKFNNNEECLIGLFATKQEATDFLKKIFTKK